MKTKEECLAAIPESAKTLEDFLALVPRHLSVEEWQKRVRKDFAHLQFDPLNETCREMLGRTLLMKPRTLAERWWIEAEGWKREAEAKEAAKRNIGK